MSDASASPEDGSVVALPRIVSQKKKEELNNALEEMNGRYAVVQIGETARVADFEGRDITFLKKNDFLTFHGNKSAWIEDDDTGKIKKVPIAKNWLEWPHRRTYEKLVFKPAAKSVDEGSYNLWRGWPVKPKKDGGSFALFFDHIKTNICNGDEEIFRWVIGWLCDLFQNPAQKIGVALVLRSPEEGTGKGFFVNKIGALIGRHFDTYLHSERIVGKFNAHLRDKLLVFMDEAMWAGDKQARGVLYGLITEPTITVEAKGMMPEQTDSYLRVVMASNHDWVAPAGPTARRFCVLDVANYSRNNGKYFQDIEDELKSGGYSALLWYFLNTPYDREFIRKPIKTAALMDQKVSGLENELAWFYECVKYNKIGDAEFGTTIAIDTIRTEDFYNAYIAWAEKNAIRKPCPRTTLTRSINKGCGLTEAEIPLKSIWRGNTSERWYDLFSISEYRNAFDEKFEQQLDWED